MTIYTAWTRLRKFSINRSGPFEMALTPRQKRFCQAYMTSPTAKEAVIEAGYSSKGATVTATKLIKRPEIKEHIAKLEADAAERNNIDQDELVKRLRDNYDSAKDAKQYNACNRAVELEAKMGGLLKDKVHLMGLDVTSDADLIETLAKGDAKKATVLREILGAPDTFDTPGEVSKPMINGGNPHNGAGAAGEGPGRPD